MGNIKRAKHGPEWHYQQDWIKFLKIREWCVEPTHGNLFQQGFPDLFTWHRRWTLRWIDVKNPVRYTFTKAQRKKWPIWDSFGIPIYILGECKTPEYKKLFGPPNWKDYWKPSWGKIPNVDDLLEELAQEYARLNESPPG